ncbi:unnamed protein product [Discosporangium mesarthrocarpum]
MVGGHSPVEMGYPSMGLPLSVGMMGQGTYTPGGAGVNATGSSMGQMGMQVGMHQGQGGHANIHPGVLSNAMGAHMVGHMVG